MSNEAPKSTHLDEFDDTAAVSWTDDEDTMLAVPGHHVMARAAFSWSDVDAL